MKGTGGCSGSWVTVKSTSLVLGCCSSNGGMVTAGEGWMGGAASLSHSGYIITSCSHHHSHSLSFTLTSALAHCSHLLLSHLHPLVTVFASIFSLKLRNIMLFTFIHFHITNSSWLWFIVLTSDNSLTLPPVTVCTSIFSLKQAS